MCKKSASIERTDAKPIWVMPQGKYYVIANQNRNITIRTIALFIISIYYMYLVIIAIIS